jgi:orotate phosphoribosyltransferase
MNALAARIRRCARLLGDSLATLQADGLVPLAAICVIDRQTGARAALAGHGSGLKALYTFEEIERA